MQGRALTLGPAAPGQVVDLSVDEQTAASPAGPEGPRPSAATVVRPGAVKLEPGLATAALLPTDS